MKINILEGLKHFFIKNSSAISIIVIIVIYKIINIEFPLENLFVNDKTQGLLYLIVITLPIAMLVTLLKYKSGWEKPIRKINIVLLYFIFVLGLSYYFDDKIEDINIQLGIVIILIFSVLIALKYENGNGNENGKAIYEELDVDIPVNTKDELFESRKNVLKLIKNSYSESTEESFAIGIGGLWGTGKTSLVNALKSDFEKDDKKIVIYSSVMDVNKWSEHIDFYYLELKNKLKERRVYTGLDDGLKKYFSVIKKISGENKLLQGVFDLSGNTSFSVGKKELEEQIRKSGYKIYFIVDDIERLEKDDVRKVLFFLRGILNLKNTKMFLIADRSILEGCFEQKNFIDKFVNEWIEVKDVEAKEVFDYYTKIKSTEGVFSSKELKAYLKERLKDIAGNDEQNVDEFYNDYKEVFEDLNENIFQYYSEIFETITKELENKNNKENKDKRDNEIIERLKSIIDQENNVRFIKKYIKILLNFFSILKVANIDKNCFDEEQSVAVYLVRVALEKKVGKDCNVSKFLYNSSVSYLGLFNEQISLSDVRNREQQKIRNLLIEFDTPSQIVTKKKLDEEFSGSKVEEIGDILENYISEDNRLILVEWLKEICSEEKYAANFEKLIEFIMGGKEESIGKIVEVIFLEMLRFGKYEYPGINELLTSCNGKLVEFEKDLDESYMYSKVFEFINTYVLVMNIMFLINDDKDIEIFSGPDGILEKKGTEERNYSRDKNGMEKLEDRFNDLVLDKEGRNLAEIEGLKLGREIIDEFELKMKMIKNLEVEDGVVEADNILKSKSFKEWTGKYNQFLDKVQSKESFQKEMLGEFHDLIKKEEELEDDFYSKIRAINIAMQLERKFEEET